MPTWTIAKNARVKLGGNYFINTPVLIEFEGEPFLTIETSKQTFYMGVSCNLYDKDGNKIAVIVRNRIYPRKDYKDACRIEGNADHFILSDNITGENVVDIKIRREAEPMDLEMNASLYMPNGLLVKATPESINLPRDNQIIGGVFTGLRYGININSDGRIMIGGF